MPLSVRGGGIPCVARLCELGEHDRSGDAVVGGDPQGVSGAVVSQVKTSCRARGVVGAGESVVREVACQVRWARGSSGVGRFGLLRLGVIRPRRSVSGHGGLATVIDGGGQMPQMVSGRRPGLGRSVPCGAARAGPRPAGVAFGLSRAAGAGFEDGRALRFGSGPELVEPRS